MTERRRILLSSIGIMMVVALLAAAIAIYVLYNAAFEVHRARLSEVVQSRARIIEAVARFDAQYSQTDVRGGAGAATLSQIVEAHENFRGFGETGEFTLARREGNEIVWLLRHRHEDLEVPRPTPLYAKVAEPMRRALSGEGGTVVGLDYRGVEVLAAYEELPVLGWGVVAKIDITEIRKPFTRAGLLVAGIAFLVIAIGVGFILRVTSPLIQRVEARTAALERAHGELEARVEERTASLLEANRQLEQEIADRKRAEETLQFLLRELRVKNTLAVVQSVAEQTLQSSASLAEFGEAFQGRIRALARLHEAGAENKWGPLPLRQLVELTVAPFRQDPEHVSIQGDAVVLAASSAAAIGIALHELATNAAKHGALSIAGGRIEVSWWVELTPEGNRLRITWAESGGPAVAKPSRRGLGTAFIEEGIAYELGGEAKLRFPVTGARCEIVIPFAALAGEP
jgi:two-component sensor histidine kinase